MSTPFNEVEMMILSQLAYKEPNASSINNGNGKIYLSEFIEANYDYLAKNVGEDVRESLDSLYAKVSGENESDYTIVKSSSGKYGVGFYAFAVQGPDDDTVTVAARGSESETVKDVVQDFVVQDFIGVGVLVEGPQNMEMNNFMEDLEGYDSVYLTGHSLGGNLAVSGAVGFEDTDKIKGVYTFNSPGQNYAFCETHKEGIAAVSDKTVNYQNEGDIVSDINTSIGKTIYVKSETGDSVELTNNFTNHFLPDMSISNGSFVTTGSKSDIHYQGNAIVTAGTTVLSGTGLAIAAGTMFVADEVVPTVKKIGSWFEEKFKALGEWVGDTFVNGSENESKSNSIANYNSTGVCSGTINTEKINAAHSKIKEIVEAYKNVNLEVSEITGVIKENWVGEGLNEFESQYNLLIKKIEDFGDVLIDIYDALVDAEADYEAGDDSLRQEFVKSISK